MNTKWQRYKVHYLRKYADPLYQTVKNPYKDSSSSSMAHASIIFNGLPGEYSCTVGNLAIGVLISSVQNTIQTSR